MEDGTARKGKEWEAPEREDEEMWDIGTWKQRTGGKRGLDDGNDRMERGQKDGDKGMKTEPGRRDVD